MYRCINVPVSLNNDAWMDQCMYAWTYLCIGVWTCFDVYRCFAIGEVAGRSYAIAHLDPRQSGGGVETPQTAWSQNSNI